MNKEDVTKKKEHVKKFLKRNWPILLATAVGGATGMIMVKKISDRQMVNDKFLEYFKTDKIGLPSSAKEIDEDIFTVVAPMIEDAVLDKMSEGFYLDRTYQAGEDLKRIVKVTVENVTES